MHSLIHKVRNIFLRRSLRIHAKIYNCTSSRTLARMLSDPENKGERQQHINFDILGTWDNRIDLPILMQQSIKLGKPIPQISIKNVGVASVTGRRLTNEDRVCIKELQPNLLYFAVFDGHGGTTCADFCSQHMEQHILHWLSRNTMDLESVLQKAFIEVNNAFARNVIFMSSKEERVVSGTTATVCLLRNSIELVVGHAGDSRALLCRNGDVQKLTVDHHGTLKSEKERIVKSGGFIKTDSVGRHLVNGRLAMTRSLGDMDLKPYGVTALPDTRSIQIKHGKDAFVILTTDGINFVMNDEEIINAVNSCHYPQEAASFITDQAMQFASEDNATALVLPFGAWGKYKNGGNITMYNFGRNLSRSSRF